MKLASLRHGRDGRLVVVSPGGTHFTPADDIAASLREALEDWVVVEPRLRERADALAAGKVDGRPLDFDRVTAPLPRTFDWIDSSAYRNHVELMSRVMGLPYSEGDVRENPIIYQGAGDDMLGPTEDVILGDPNWGLDLEAEFGAVLDDVPMGASGAEVEDRIRLFVLLDDLSLRGLLGDELKRGFGPVRAKPATAFAPFAVTPDELGSAWSNGLLDLEVHTFVNGRQIGRLRSATDVLHRFSDIGARVAQTRRLTAGTILGSGTVSNPHPLETARFEQGGCGFACIAEIRAQELLTQGAPATPFLGEGDIVRIEARDAEGEFPFGVIQHRIRAPRPQG